MERMSFELESAGPVAPRRPPVVVGVVASGNLEVMVEHGGAAGRCRIEVATSAHGFGEIWLAVLADFTQGHHVAGLAFSVNDAGATPAVVSLRLAQAAEEYLGGAP